MSRTRTSDVLTLRADSDAASPARLRPAERAFLVYFGYTLLAVVIVGGMVWRVAMTGAAVGTIIGIVGSQGKRGAGEQLRDWLPLPLILVAYWQMDAIRLAASPFDFARRWLPLDAWLLLRLHIGGSGWGTPASWILEVAYAATYAIPPLAVGLLYALGRRDRIDRFYMTLSVGTLLSYGLLPFFPSLSPRSIDPSSWAPPMTAMRHFNIWLLDHADIRTSVFPSGHVAVATSAAFGMITALPDRKWIGAAMLALTSLIALATVYGRYHYTIDVIASVGLSIVSWGTTVYATRIRT